jgi:hypothetical protein
MPEAQTPSLAQIHNIAEKIVSVLNLSVSVRNNDLRNIDTFIERILLASNETVEHSCHTLTEKANFNHIDLRNLHNLYLKDIKFSEKAGEEGRIFIISDRYHAEKKVEFSARNLGELELRGARLKNELTKLKKQKPNISLYDALTILVRNPYDLALQSKALLQQGLCDSLQLEDPEQATKILKQLVKPLAKLSTAFLDYIAELRGQKSSVEWDTDKKEPNISDAEITKLLKKVFTYRGLEMIQLALDEHKSADDIKSFFREKAAILENITQNEVETFQDNLEQSQKWIQTIRELADNPSYAQYKPNIMAVAESAEALVNWYSSEISFFKGEETDEEREASGYSLKNPQVGVKSVNNFCKAVNDAQKLPIGELSWKNVLNVFLFLPSIVNLIHSHGRSFWLRNNPIAKEFKENSAQILHQASIEGLLNSSKYHVRASLH